MIKYDQYEGRQIDLKPCPFCGGEAETLLVADYTFTKQFWNHVYVRVACKSCLAGTEIYEEKLPFSRGASPSEEEKKATYLYIELAAIHAGNEWNRRSEKEENTCS